MIKKALGRGYMALWGWKVVGAPPANEPKFVLIAAPHTSNWDFPFALALCWIYGVKLSWLGKSSLFKPPLGWLLKAVGGISVNREARTNLVSQAAEKLRESKALALMVPAEGTRARAEYWKSGFLHIAKQAEVPIVLGYLDFGKKQGGFGPAVSAQGDVKELMDKIRAFYADKTAKFPEDFGPVRLKEESISVAAAETPKAANRGKI